VQASGRPNLKARAALLRRELPATRELLKVFQESETCKPRPAPPRAPRAAPRARASPAPPRPAPPAPRPAPVQAPPRPAPPRPRGRRARRGGRGAAVTGALGAGRGGRDAEARVKALEKDDCRMTEELEEHPCPAPLSYYVDTPRPSPRTNRTPLPCPPPLRSRGWVTRWRGQEFAANRDGFEAGKASDVVLSFCYDKDLSLHDVILMSRPLRLLPLPPRRPHLTPGAARSRLGPAFPPADTVSLGLRATSGGATDYFGSCRYNREAPAPPRPRASRPPGPWSR